MINGTSGSLKDSASKVGFRLIALLGQLACENTQKLQSHDYYVIADDCVPKDLYLCTWSVLAHCH